MLMNCAIEPEFITADEDGMQICFVNSNLNSPADLEVSIGALKSLAIKIILLNNTYIYIQEYVCMYVCMWYACWKISQQSHLVWLYLYGTRCSEYGAHRRFSIVLALSRLLSVCAAMQADAKAYKEINWTVHCEYVQLTPSEHFNPFPRMLSIFSIQLSIAYIQ